MFDVDLGSSVWWLDSSAMERPILPKTVTVLLLAVNLLMVYLPVSSADPTVSELFATVDKYWSSINSFSAHIVSEGLDGVTISTVIYKSPGKLKVTTDNPKTHLVINAGNISIKDSQGTLLELPQAFIDTVRKHILRTRLDSAELFQLYTVTMDSNHSNPSRGIFAANLVEKADPEVRRLIVVKYPEGLITKMAGFRENALRFEDLIEYAPVLGIPFHTRTTTTIYFVPGTSITSTSRYIDVKLNHVITDETFNFE